MNLKELFDMQRVLDDRIIKEKGLEGHDLLQEKTLALQVELGELANEWRGFKFWSEDQKPRTKKLRHPAMMEEDKEYYNPMLEEYVDCLHFILSLGLELYEGDQELIGLIEIEKRFDLTIQFRKIFYLSGRLLSGGYASLFGTFIGLGEMLGFTWDQIEQAYMEKNKINHQRQSNGY